MGKTQYDFGFAEISVQITGHQGFRIDKETGDMKSYVLAKFENINTGRKTQHSCYQDWPKEDVERDVDLIKNGNISSTNFYKHWMKLFFEPGEVFKFIDSEGNIEEGYFVKQDNWREYTFYFDIGKKRVKIDGYKVILDGEEYLL